MRVLFLAFLIALLPIRGWLGDAMAIEMAQHSMPVAETVAGAAHEAAGAHCHEAAGDMAMDAMDSHHDAPPASHGTHAQADVHDDGGDAEHQGHDGCDTCTACQVCHSVALGGSGVQGAAHDAPQAAPAALAERFASAERSPRLKPPIS